MSDGRSMTTARALRLLDLEQPVAPPQLRQAYRDLVRVWHPDRFEGDARLRQKASVRLSEINAAYRFLSSLAPEPPRARTAGSVHRATPPSGGSHAAAARRRAHRAARAAAPAPRRGNAGRAASHIGLLVVVLATFALGAAPRFEAVLEPRAERHASSAAASDIALPATPLIQPAVLMPRRLPAAPVVAAVATHGAAAAETSYPRRSPFSRDLDRILARANR